MRHASQKQLGVVWGKRMRRGPAVKNVDCNSAEMHCRGCSNAGMERLQDFITDAASCQRTCGSCTVRREAG